MWWKDGTVPSPLSLGTHLRLAPPLADAQLSTKPLIVSSTSHASNLDLWAPVFSPFNIFLNMLLPFAVLLVNLLALATASSNHDTGGGKSPLGPVTRPDDAAAEAKALAIANMTDSAQLTSREMMIDGKTYAGVYLCGGTDWRGPCYWQATSGGNCHSWPAGWGKAISFGPDIGILCRTYQFGDCRGAVSTGIIHPGYGNLVPVVPWTPGSFKCEWYI